MKKLALISLFIFALGLAATAQKKMKPWTEWSEKEVNKMLNDSAWGQTQNETNTSEMFYNPTSQGKLSSRPLDNTGGSTGTDKSAQGALNQATNISYRVRLLTAKPIRQAIARRAQMANPQLAEQLKAFAEQKTDKYIVVAVDYDASDKRVTGSAMQILNSLTTSVLKNNTYIEVKSGQRLFLQEYMAPIADGMGAKFVFPRSADGKPFVSEESGYLRFYSELNKDLKLNMRFKVNDMIYDGNLEY